MAMVKLLSPPESGNSYQKVMAHCISSFTWTLVSAHKETQNQVSTNNKLLFSLFLFSFFEKAGWGSQAAFGGPSKSMLVPQLNQPRAPPVVMCPPFRDAQAHPVKVAMTVDTILLATQQEKESLLFQPWNYSGGSRDHKQHFPCSDPHANFSPLPFLSTVGEQPHYVLMTVINF